MIRPFTADDVLLLTLALRWTIALSVFAFAGGAVFGLLIALARCADNRVLKGLATGYIRVFQGTPLLMQLFLAYFGLNIVGLPVNPLASAILALTLHASAFLGEIWRGCIQAIPPGQREAATALGLGYFHRMRWVILPQAARVAVAPTVGFLVQLIKGTSLASIIGFVELTRTGQLINNATFQPFMVFGTVAALYFVLCWPLSLLARNMEARLARATVR